MMVFFRKSKFTRTCFTVLTIVISIYITGFVIFSLTCPHLAIIGRISKDRFGDQLIIYSKAKWFAYKYNIPFLLVPFKKSEQLTLFDEEQHCSKLAYALYPVLYSIFGRYVKVRTEHDITKTLKQNSKLPTLFISRIGTILNEHIKHNTNYKNTAWLNSLLYELTIQNPTFGKHLIHMLQPKEKINPLTLPKDKTTVAIHIRKGGGFDPKLISKQYYDTSTYNTEYKEIDISIDNTQNITSITKNITTIDTSILTNIEGADQSWPEKFPPEQYYVDQIKKLFHMLNHQPLYVHIFTDDKKPNELKKRIKKAVNLPHITFACNKHNASMLEDFFAMTQFDCLIRPVSGFSYFPQVLGKHKIIMYPLHLAWIKPNLLIVNKVGIIHFDRTKVRSI
jgi:hypothetical protein